MFMTMPKSLYVNARMNTLSNRIGWRGVVASRVNLMAFPFPSVALHQPLVTPCMSTAY